jgi:8-oxo-dGTP diphosphatase
VTTDWLSTTLNSVAKAVDATRAEVERLELPFGFLPMEFTLGELQATCEQLLGRRLDKSSFRRRLAERDVLEPVVGVMRGGAFRPAQLYRERR